LYIDDFLGGAQNIKEGFNIYQGATKMMKAGGFNLRKWSTNNNVLDQQMSAGTTSTQDTIVKVLGISWDSFFEFSDLIKYVSALPPNKEIIA